MYICFNINQETMYMGFLTLKKKVLPCFLNKKLNSLHWKFKQLNNCNTFNLGGGCMYLRPGNHSLNKQHLYHRSPQVVRYGRWLSRDVWFHGMSFVQVLVVNAFAHQLTSSLDRERPVEGHSLTSLAGLS